MGLLKLIPLHSPGVNAWATEKCAEEVTTDSCSHDEAVHNTSIFEAATELEPDPVIEFYKKDVDRTLIRENLQLTVQQRFEKLERLKKFAEELRRAGRDKEIENLTDAALKSVDSPPANALRPQPTRRR